MPLFRNLNEQEKKILIHKIKNNTNSEKQYLSDLVNKELEKKLSKISEEENYKAKNRYRL